MKLIEVWELFKKHNINTCGTHKLLVTLKRSLPNGIREGYIFEDPRDADGCEYELYLDDVLEIEDYDPFEEEVASVYCPYCCEIIYQSEESEE
jgi:hypothetical protein